MIMVMIMKVKFIFPIIMAILLGFFSAKIVYGLYSPNNSIFYNSYFLQWGVYSNKESLNKTLKEKKIDSYLIVEENDKYYVYVGITTDKKMAEKIKNIYGEKNNDIYIKTVKLENNEFYNNLEQYDILLNGVSNNEDILSINKVILSSYEEMVLNT